MCTGTVLCDDIRSGLHCQARFWISWIQTPLTIIIIGGHKFIKFVNLLTTKLAFLLSS